MKQHPEASVVRLFTADDTPVGTGFLVTEDVVLTCAHVVVAALSMEDIPSEAPEAEVRLDFPLVKPHQYHTAHITFWQPPQRNSGDIALLHLNEYVPEGATAANLVVHDELWNHDFRTFGFPAYHDEGVWASGKLRAREATGWVQIEDVKEAGHRIQPGFSGGAVWDEQLDGVAGMVVAAERDPTTKAAYMIPTKVLISTCPQLGQRAIPSCPYRGLFAFREQDTPYFFGREVFTQQLVDAVSRKPLIAVIGPSGSGKSSVVFAGLIPRLRVAGNWSIISLHPGHRPYHSLAAALIPLLEPQKSETDRLIEINKLARNLQQRAIALQDVVEMVMQKDVETRMLLVVDQFEELYTLCRELEVRQRFQDELSKVVLTMPQQSVFNFNVVLTLRADFLGQVLSYRPFADALHYADLKLGPMNIQELQDAIEKPAEKLHVCLEEGLTKRILNETREAGHLPLLEFALTLLWARQQESKLTHKAYEEIGGVGQALADHAEQVYNRLNKEEQLQAQYIFVQLVRPGEGTEDTRRFTSRTELGENNWSMVVRLANARLVVTARDETTGDETVEVVHEALIQSWQRLQKWIEENREFRMWQERLRIALRQWETKGRDPDALLRGALVVDAAEWAKKHAEEISPHERTFIETSQYHQEEETQRWKALYIEAERQRQIALARGLAVQSELLRSQYPHLLELSVLLAIESILRFQSMETDQVLRQGAAQLRRRLASTLHNEAVTAVAFSPNGYCLAVACEDSTVSLWNTSLEERLASLPHQKLVTALAFSPDSRYLATVCGNDTVLLWDVSTSDCLPSVSHQEKITAVAFSPDGQRLATACSDNTAALWDLSTGERLAAFPHQKKVTAVAFSPDGQRLATACSDNTATLWDLSTGYSLAVFPHRGPVCAVAFSPNGRYVATASRDNTAVIRDVLTGERLVLFRHQDTVWSVAFSPDSRRFATASGDHTAVLWDTFTGERLALFRHQDMVWSVAFSPDGHHLATASDDATTALWDISTDNRFTSLSHQDMVWSVAFSPDGRHLATASADHTAKLWDVATGQCLHSFPHQERVIAVTFSPDGHYLTTTSVDHTVTLWNTATGQRLTSLSHTDTVWAVAFSPDGRHLATASADHTAKLWDVATGQCLTTLIHQNIVGDVAFSPDGQYLATACMDHTAKLWNLSTYHCLILLPHRRPVRAVAFSPDGRCLATAGDDARAKLWDLSHDYQSLSLHHHDSVVAVTFSLDGRYLATISADRTATLWNVLTGHHLASLPHQNVVNAATFSPDGQTLATASYDGTVGIWEVPSGQQLARLNHEESVRSIAFSPDGKYLATASGDSTARIWLVRSEDLIVEASMSLTRNLTENEWKQYVGDEPYHKTLPGLP